MPPRPVSTPPRPLRVRPSLTCWNRFAGASLSDRHHVHTGNSRGVQDAAAVLLRHPLSASLCLTAPRASYYSQDALVDFSAAPLCAFFSHGGCFLCLSASLFRPDDLDWRRFHETLNITLAAARFVDRAGRLNLNAVGRTRRGVFEPDSLSGRGQITR